MTIQLKIAARDAHDAFAAYAETAGELQLVASRVGHSNQSMSHRDLGAALSKFHQQGVELLSRALARGQHSIALGQMFQAPGVTETLCRFDEQIGHLMSEERSGRIDRRQLEEAIKVTGRAAQDRITAIIGVIQRIVADVEQHPDFGAQPNTSPKSAPILLDTPAATTVSTPPVHGSATETSADRVPVHQTWTRRWWRTPGESLLDGKPIDGKTVSATLTWCHSDEWGIAASHPDGKVDLIFNTETSSYDGQPDFIHTGGAPEYVIRILGTHLMRRLGRGLRVAAQDPIVVELAKQFPTTSWVSGTRLRQATKLNLEEFAARVDKLIPRFVRKEFSLDPSREIYGLTLPALLLVDNTHAELIEKVFQGIAHRFHADPDAEAFDRSDLVAVGWTDPDLKVAARLAELALLVGGPAADRGLLRMPNDREAIAEAVKQKVAFAKYVVDAAGANRREHYPVHRPWLTAPLWLERDGSQLDYVPGALLSVSLTNIGSQLAAQEVPNDSERPQVPGYILLETLPGGAGGEVYLARENRDGGVERVIKLFIPHPFADEQDPEPRFRSEVEALLRLQHKAIVRYVSSGVLDGVRPVFYLVMEFVKGARLQSRATSMSFELRVSAMIEILDGLEHAHSKSIFHRDIKPSNIMIRESDNQPVLVDFGLAYLVGDELDDDRTRIPLGTPGYIPPEVSNAPKKSRDPRHDVYQAGVTLYVILAGHRPDPYVPLEMTDVGLRSLDPIVRRALAEEPAARFPTAAAFATELRAWLEQQSRRQL